MSELECRNLCSVLDACIGIDMYKYANRCYLNTAGPAGASTSCEHQYTTDTLGSTSAYDFLYKGAVAQEERAVTLASGVSTDEILRFGPVGFDADAGKYKVCFCDSDLLPANQGGCLAEKDYSLEVGELYVSG